MNERTRVSGDREAARSTSRNAARSSADTPRRAQTVPLHPVDARPAAESMRQLQDVAQARFTSPRHRTLQAMMRRGGDGAGLRVVQRCKICKDDDCENGELCGKKDEHAVFAAPQGPEGPKHEREDVSADVDAAIRAAFAAGMGPKTKPVPSSPNASPDASPAASPRAEKKAEGQDEKDQ